VCVCVRVRVFADHFRYYDGGPRRGEVLVCLPGASGTAEIFYKQMLSLCPKGYRVVLVQSPPYYTHEAWLAGVVPSCPPCLPHTHAHARTHTHTYTRAHADTRPRPETHTPAQTRTHTRGWVERALVSLSTFPPSRPPKIAQLHRARLLRPRAACTAAPRHMVWLARRPCCISYVARCVLNGGALERCSSPALVPSLALHLNLPRPNHTVTASMRSCRICASTTFT
jgi:hypothetical protein